MDLQTVTDRAPWHAVPHMALDREGMVALLDLDTPNWIATDARGARILSWLDGRSRPGSFERILGGVRELVASGRRLDQSAPSGLSGRAVSLSPQLSFVPDPSSGRGPSAASTGGGVRTCPTVGPPTCRLCAHVPRRVKRFLPAQTGLGQRRLDGPGGLQDQSGWPVPLSRDIRRTIIFICPARFPQ